MSYEDRTLSYKEYGKPFTFSADDQGYHADSGYTDEPQTLCGQLSGEAHQSDGDGSADWYNRGPRGMHPVACAECGRDTAVPFRPRGDRQVYCNDRARRPIGPDPRIPYDEGRRIARPPLSHLTITRGEQQ